MIKFKPHTLVVEDLKYLSELLKTGLPLRTCLDLISTNTNKNIIDNLLNRLDKGEMIENIANDYLPKEIAGYTRNLLKNISFKESLELSLSFYMKNKENAKALEKAITYPLVLLFISLTGLYLFDSYGLNSIISLLKSFNSDINSFSFIRILLKIIIYFFYFGFLIVSSTLLYYLNKKRIIIFYIILCKYFPNSLIKTYFTEDFISLFVITINLGYKTKDALELLKRLDNKPLVAFLSFHLDELLLEGNSLKEASNQKYYDEVLTKFISIASYSTNFSGILTNYVELAKEKIANRMKLYTSILQVFSYLVIGFVIIFIYQVLFLPMKALINI